METYELDDASHILRPPPLRRNSQFRRVKKHGYCSPSDMTNLWQRHLTMASLMYSSAFVLNCGRIRNELMDVRSQWESCLAHSMMSHMGGG